MDCHRSSIRRSVCPAPADVDSPGFYDMLRAVSTPSCVARCLLMVWRGQQRAILMLQSTTPRSSSLVRRTAPVTSLQMPSCLQRPAPSDISQGLVSVVITTIAVTRGSALPVTLLSIVGVAHAVSMVVYKVTRYVGVGYEAGAMATITTTPVMVGVLRTIFAVAKLVTVVATERP